jgi:hypothetical protein
MNLREAAQQALEALENCLDIVQHEYENDWRHGLPTREKQLAAMRDMVQQHEAAITALRTALAEPERKPLTDEKIWLEYQRFWPFHPAEEPRLAKDIAKFARAIERAHGIGGEA